jgi:hypothetical protein
MAKWSPKGKFLKGYRWIGKGTYTKKLAARKQRHDKGYKHG